MSSSEKAPLTASGDVEAGRARVVSETVARTKLRLQIVCCEAESRLAMKSLEGVEGVVGV